MRTLGSEVARRLRSEKWVRQTMLWFDADGEIQEVREGPLEREDDLGDAARVIIICCYGVPIREDWKERGVVPPRGWWRQDDGEWVRIA